MGSSQSAAPPPAPPAPPRVLELHARGVCSDCIARILGLGRADLDGLDLALAPGAHCTVCAGIMQRIPSLRDAARAAIGPHACYDIQIELPASVAASDNATIDELRCAPSCLLKNHLKAALAMSLRRVRGAPVLRVTVIERSFRCSLQWPNLYVTGRYLKASRRVSHARFMPGVRPASSVEGELTAAFSSLIPCADVRFASAGREDMDVRMLGTGRPFCVTLVSPSPSGGAAQTTSDLISQLLPSLPPDVVCGYGVSASNLSLTLDEPDMSPRHTKEYECVVSCARAVTDTMLARVDAIDDLPLRQRTPARVAHRREMMDRDKRVLSARATRICDSAFVLRLATSTGTYIKEFVNGDFGRTVPSLAAVLDPDDPVQCQILQLDVVRVGET